MRRRVIPPRGRLPDRTDRAPGEGPSTADTIAECAAEAAELCAALGVPEMTEEEEERLLPQIDPAAAVGADMDEMLRIYRTSRELRSDIRDTRAVVRSLEHKALRKLVQWIKGQLAREELDPDQRRQLESDAAPLLSLWEGRKRSGKQEKETGPEHGSHKTQLLRLLMELRLGKAPPGLRWE